MDLEYSLLTLVVSIVLGLYLIWYFWHIFSIKIGLRPPGPTPFPFIGNAHLIKPTKAYDIFEKLHKEYGPVITFHGVWNRPIIIINDYKVLNQLLVRSGNISSGKKEIEFFKNFRTKPSILFSDYGERWKQLRKFSSATLRYFGMGKRSIENHITTELSLLTSEIAAQNGKPYNIKMLLHQSVASVIYRLVAGQRISRESDVYKYAVEAFVKTIHDPNIAKHAQLLRTFYFLRHLPVIKKNFQLIMKNNLRVRKILMDVVKEHRSTFNKNDIRDLIDQYLLELDDKKFDESFTLDCLVDLFFDLFAAGNDTSANMLQWCLISVAENHMVQEKILSEIQSVIGESIPQLKHQQFMPYTRAFIQEMYRICPVVPMSFRKLTESTNIGGFNIPKDTRFVINIWALHHDPKIFHEPNVFKPERFLDEDEKFIKCDEVIPFSLGQRNCLGQQLAITEVFIFLCGILQKFKVTKVKDLPKFTEGILNVTYSPIDFKLAYNIR